MRIFAFPKLGLAATNAAASNAPADKNVRPVPGPASHQERNSVMPAPSTMNVVGQTTSVSTTETETPDVDRIVVHSPVPQGTSASISRAAHSDNVHLPT
jgi:hypothetical protein